MYDKQLIPEKYPQGDLFICDVADAILKDILPQMEHRLLNRKYQFGFPHLFS
jgi:hypothetical protein